METKPANAENLESAIRTILECIGENPDREGLKETPERIARMFGEIFRGYDKAQSPKITTFSNEHHQEEMIFDSGDYYSMCEHHMMPFFGKYFIAYIPDRDGKILGLSKIGRVVDYCSAKLQLQERLAWEVVETLSNALHDEKYPAKGFAICMKGEHLCKTMRGAKKSGKMAVINYTGIFKHNRELQKHFIEMVNNLV